MAFNTAIQLAVVGLTCKGALAFNNSSQITNASGYAAKWNLTSRSSQMCVPLAIHQFPKDLLNDSQRERGGVLLYILATVYIFGCLAYLCDGYFVPALENFTERMRIKPEVAGASLMAIGNSSPELFTSLIGVYVSEDDVGVGTVVGSAVFNILFVIGACILVSPTVLNVEVYPVMRDASFYVMSLIPLAIICLDGKVDWYDACALVLLYGVYLTIIYNSSRIEEVFYKLFPCAATDEEEKEIRLNDSLTDENNAKCTELDFLQGNKIEEVKVHDDGGYETNAAIVDALDITIDIDPNKDRSPFYLPEGKIRKAGWMIGFPIILLFWITIPDASNPKWQKWFPLTFLMCILYMGTFSYVLVYFVTIIGYTFGIPDIVMGLVFIACGCNPDAIATIIIAKHGKGRMSISNCIGANIFHILLSLGLPWLTRTLVTHHGKSVDIISGSIKFTIFMLIGSVVSMIFTFMISRWKLRWPAGLMLITTYLGLITVACLFEMNVFGSYNLPQCE